VFRRSAEQAATTAAHDTILSTFDGHCAADRENCRTGLAARAAAAQEAPPVTPPTVDIVAPSPLPGLGIDRDKVPSNTQSVQAPQITTQGPTPARFVGYSEVESCCKDSLIIWTTA
jgi:hypothetical protein